jgi:hypothetical protein
LRWTFKGRQDLFQQVCELCLFFALLFFALKIG